MYDLPYNGSDNYRKAAVHNIAYIDKRSLTKLSHKNLLFPNQHSFILPQRFHVIKRTERRTAFRPVPLLTL